MPASSTNLRALCIVPAVIVLCILAGVGFSHPLHATPKATAAPAPKSASTTPSLLAQQGRVIFGFTPTYASAWTGNTLSCTDCHLLDGTVPHASPLIDVANLFPSFNKRAGHVITLQQRIQECFVRSENGKPLPTGSMQMKALVAYIQFLSRNGVKGKPYQGRGLVKLPALTGNPIRGEALYGLACAVCHQADGVGLPGAYPPVWGSQAYNNGAGMDRVPKLAAWLQHNMPLDRPGSLTPQQAFDVSAYIDSQPHPEFNHAYKSY